MDTDITSALRMDVSAATRAPLMRLHRPETSASTSFNASINASSTPNRSMNKSLSRSFSSGALSKTPTSKARTPGSGQ